jgi:hypothetical protein
MADPEDLRNAAKFAAVRYTAGVALEAGAEHWLRGEGFEVEVLSGPVDKGVDLPYPRSDATHSAPSLTRVTTLIAFAT